MRFSITIIFFHENKSYYDIITELKPKNILPTQTCHVDPDIKRNILKRGDNWKPIFGQADAAQRHLENNKICEVDIFLFFGWFRKTIVVNDKLLYEPASPDHHIIYGYLQIGEIIQANNTITGYAKYHSHSHGTLHPIKPIACMSQMINSH